MAFANQLYVFFFVIQFPHQHQCCPATHANMCCLPNLHPRSQPNNLAPSRLPERQISLNVRLYRMYGEGRSAGFELSDPDTDEILFTMDMDVNRPVQPTQMYDVAGLRFRGISPMQILADKISAISTDKVFRRIKDVVDLYYLSQVFELDQNSLMQTMNNSGRHLESFDGFLHRADDLRHAYEKFRFTGDATKPAFDEVYEP